MTTYYIITTEHCPKCRAVKNKFKSQQIEYIEIAYDDLNNAVDNNPVQIDKEQVLAVPTIVISNDGVLQYLCGMDAVKYARGIKLHGGNND